MAKNLTSAKFIVPVVVLVLVALGAWWFISRGSGIDTKDGELSAAEEKAVIEKVASLFETPKETPVLAVIVDADTLVNEQSFYNGAVDGDVLLVYPKAAKAVIYGVKEERLVNVGPIVLGGPQGQAGATNAPAAASDATPATNQ